ncbi:MAG TPA: hypothetical protein VFJ58_05920 [Armatimonadota bacterium]|nr:hypothetical protein [Armatimonadota bacterium]
MQMGSQMRLFFAGLAALLCVCSLSAARGETPVSHANGTILGPNVFVFDPGMPAADVQRTAIDIFKKMEANQFGSERYALLFKPGTYNVTFNVGFYTQVAGLGQNPDDVVINGGVNVNAKWDPNGNALNNFWRSMENFAVTPSSNIPYQTVKGITRIAVSQAAPLRRLHVKGELQLFDWGPAGNVGYASGGFLADSVVDGKVVPGSQQQWLSRNSRWGGWNNAVWNMVFVGCENAPGNTFPNPPYTVVDRTPVIREKPYLYVNHSGEYCVFVPALETNTRGVSWASGPTPGASVPLSQFYVAQPATATAARLNAALAAGKHLLFTPGVYHLDQPLRITRANTIVYGLGFPSLIPTRGQPVISVADVGGVKIAGLIVDAGAAKSPALLEVGPAGSKVDHAADPTFLYDITVRTGGSAPGKNDVGVVINSNNVVVDNIWIWRADHGAGVGWTSNPTRNGLVVNGDNVTIYGLFNEHHEQYQTLWNGNGGRVYFYQSEMPYDVPDQASWMSGATDGYASYKVAKTVTSHEAWGVGVYCYFRDAAVKANSAIEAPAVPGVRFHNLTTVWLDGKNGSEITHIINNLGGRVYAHTPGAVAGDAMRQIYKDFGGKPLAGAH